MTVSVVMATYNGVEYLEEQLDTIREQTRSVNELIICDDGSTDNTVGILKDYISRYGLAEKWQVYENSSNLGYADNFNHAASLATGDLLFSQIRMTNGIKRRFVSWRRSCKSMRIASCFVLIIIRGTL